MVKATPGVASSRIPSAEDKNGDILNFAARGGRSYRLNGIVFCDF